MGKFKQAMNTAKQSKDVNTDLQNAGVTDLHESGSTESGNAVNTENSKAVKTELQDNGDPVLQEKLVSLTIKVPESLRQHWQIEAKRRRTSVTKLITEYLSQELGKP